MLFSLYLIYDGGIFLTGILWIDTFPVFLYYLKGIRRGNIWAGSIVLLIMFMVLLAELGVLVFPYPSFYLIASLVIFITISVLIIFYEDTKSKSLELATYQLSHDLYTGLPNQARLIHDIQAMEDGALLRLDINNLTDIDFLKLDASLIKPLGSDKNSEIMVQSIIHFAQKINVRTIAEYVSNETIHSIVSGLGVDYSQGYFIGKPARIIREVKSA